MALKPTIHKAALDVSDIDRGVYAGHALTLARQPSETEERLMMRLLAFALNVPGDDAHGTLQAAGGIADADEPDWWQPDLTGRIVHWIEVGQPDGRRMARACGRADRVTILTYGASAPIWHAGVAAGIARLANLRIVRVEADQSRALAALCSRAMKLQVTVQDGLVWASDDARTVEIAPTTWHPR